MLIVIHKKCTQDLVILGLSKKTRENQIQEYFQVFFSLTLIHNPPNPQCNIINIVPFFVVQEILSQGWGKISKLKLNSAWNGSGVSRGFAHIQFTDPEVEDKVDLIITLQIFSIDQ